MSARYRAWRLSWPADSGYGRRAGQGTLLVYEAATSQEAQGMARAWIPGALVESVEASREEERRHAP